MNNIIRTPRPEALPAPSLDLVLSRYDILAVSPNHFERHQVRVLVDQLLPLCEQLLKCVQDKSRLVAQRENTEATYIYLEKNRATIKELSPIMAMQSKLQEDNSNLAVRSLTLVTRIKAILIMPQAPVNDGDGTESLPVGALSNPAELLHKIREINNQLQALGITI